METKAERDERICEELLAGKAVKQVALDEGITKQRVHQIAEMRGLVLEKSWRRKV